MTPRAGRSPSRKGSHQGPPPPAGQDRRWLRSARGGFPRPGQRTAERMASPSRGRGWPTKPKSGALDPPPPQGTPFLLSAPLTSGDVQSHHLTTASSTNRTSTLLNKHRQAKLPAASVSSVTAGKRPVSSPNRIQALKSHERLHVASKYFQIPILMSNTVYIDGYNP